jgi:hypothetical protein
MLAIVLLEDVSRFDPVNRHGDKLAVYEECHSFGGSRFNEVGATVRGL